MKREDAPAPHLLPPREQVEMALADIGRSAAFRSSARHRALLHHLVAGLYDPATTPLKETVIAVEVFGRPAASFDPKQDSIVRVEARRLRSRLAAYYRAEGSEATLRIELPVGSYLPVIAERGEHFLRQALSKATLERARERFEQALQPPASCSRTAGWRSAPPRLCFLATLIGHSGPLVQAT